MGDMNFYIWRYNINIVREILIGRVKGKKEYFCVMCL